MTQPIIQITELTKTYNTGHQALGNINLSIQKGEILALLGSNGAGKTTMISIICGLVKATSGHVSIGGFDIEKQFREARLQVGLVPQELTLGMFDLVWDSIEFSRGLFYKKPDSAYLEQLLKDLSLLDKKHSQIRHLSGGMKRRVLIAKALAHEPSVLFLDEPTAGVDVELRKDMWDVVDRLRDRGVTIILTTHYIEEAEAMADRVGIMRKGELLLVEHKACLMKQLGQHHINITLAQPLNKLTPALCNLDAKCSEDCLTLKVPYFNQADNNINHILQTIQSEQLTITHFETSKSSLEDIFVDLTQYNQ